jgi:DNA-binding transcriptional MerR regulator
VASYSIGEVERFLGLPASTLRHWEKAFPLLSPRKDSFGRRVYSESDLRVLLRLRHLALERGLGITGAGEAFLAEMTAASSSSEAELHALLQEVRGELIGRWFESRESLRSLDDASLPRHEAADGSSVEGSSVEGSGAEGPDGKAGTP